MSNAVHRRGTTWLLYFLSFLTVLFFLWPAYRVFLNVELDTNEGWNAYYADAAWGRMPLYPSADQFITNNYPPLSFYLVGGFGRLINDNILAGRIISLVSILCIGLALYFTIRHLGGSGTASIVGSLFFVATMCRFFTGYAGMNDPQLLAHAVMTFGFLLFLRAMDQDTSLIVPILIMVLAGFIKHNIVAMPLTAFIWLAWKRPKRLPGAILVGFVAAGSGLFLCSTLYGPDFLLNLFAPRVHNWRHAVGAIGHLQWVAAGLVIWSYFAVTCRSMPCVKLCSLLVTISFIMFFMQKLGNGVADNAQFDLVIAVSVALGLAYQLAASCPLANRFSFDLLRGFLIAVICSRLLISTRLEPIRMWVDPTFHQELANRESETRQAIAQIKSIPGDVGGSTYACYLAGKPFVFDEFSMAQRIRLGYLPESCVTDRIQDRSLTLVRVRMLHQ